MSIRNEDRRAVRCSSSSFSLVALDLFCLDADCVLVGFCSTTGSLCIDLGEFSTKKQDLGRVINPEQQCD